MPLNTIECYNYRTSIEYEKKVHADQLEEGQAIEKNIR